MIFPVLLTHRGQTRVLPPPPPTHATTSTTTGILSKQPKCTWSRQIRAREKRIYTFMTRTRHLSPAKEEGMISVDVKWFEMVLNAQSNAKTTSE